LPPKAVHNWAQKFSPGCSKVSDDAQQDAELAETTAKDFYAARFEVVIKQ
jgi:hypothetical protein